MSDVSFAAQAKSDQLNAVDIMGIEPVITISEVQVTQGDQPVLVFYHGCNDRPWKPSKGMIRILMAGWGKESDNWIGNSVQIFMEPSVKYAGKEVGGVRIRAMSDISTNGIMCALTLNRQKREPYPVKFLSMERPQYPADKFDGAFDEMVKMMHAGSSIEQIVARCQQTGDLTHEQLHRLQEAAPVPVDDHSEDFDGFERQK